MHGTRDVLNVELVVDMPVWASNGIMLVEDVRPELLETVPYLVAKLMSANRNTDIAGMIGEMVTNNSAVLPSAVDDFHECSHGVILRGVGMIGYPLIHLSDVVRCAVRMKKLVSVSDSSLRH